MSLTHHPLFHTCDILWQYLIKSRAGCCCEMCGAGTNGLHAAHIIGRGAYWTRWRLRNGLALCVDCHVDAKIKAWLQETAERRRRWRWVVKQRAMVHRGRGPDLRNEYRRLKRKEAA